MWRSLLTISLTALLLAGCYTPLPPSPREVEARRFEPVAERSVIYIAREPVDHDLASTIVLDDRSTITTYAGTFYRWDVAPGRHVIRGAAVDTGAITLQTEPGRVYYVQQKIGGLISSVTSSFRLVGESEGRTIVTRGQLIPGDR